MRQLRRATALCVRWRFALLALWTLPWLIGGQHVRYPHGDWLWVELGARILVHHHAPPAGGAALHLYADTPSVQIGPPALLAAAPFQWLSPQAEGHLAAGLMSLLVLAALWCAERAARSLSGPAWLPAKTLLAGLVVVPIWTLQAQQWGHIDDVTALLAVMVAAVLISRGHHEVLAGLILGTGTAAKPWVVILLPMLLAYARPQVARSVLAFVVGALAWWAPFVVASPATVHALGSVSLLMVNHPTWHLVGITGVAPLWIRPVQLIGGLALSTVVVRRVGWSAVPAVALAWRVTTDPYDWPYYVLGPLIGAALWDLVRPAQGRLVMLPWATLAVCLAEVWLPRMVPSSSPGVRLVWFLGLTTAVFLVATSSRRRGSQLPTRTGEPAACTDRQMVGAGAPTAEVALP